MNFTSSRRVEQVVWGSGLAATSEVRAEGDVRPVNVLQEG